MTISLEAARPDQSPAATPEARTADRWRALTFLLAGYLVVFAAVTMVNVALPAAQDDLGLSDSGRQWILTTYSLAFGGLMLLGGRVGDVLGLRRAVTLGLLGFAAASLLGGLAPNGGVLLAGRALQGLAGALVAPAALALLSVMFPDGDARARAFGALGTVMGLGTAGSFVVAGWLTDAASWRWCLLVNVPIAVAAAAGLARTAPPARRDEHPRIDLWSALTITAGLTALVLAFDQAARREWLDVTTLVLLAVGVALLVAFLLVARRVSTPLFPLRLLADRTRAGAYTAVFFLAVAMFAGMYLITVYLQDELGYSALRTGVAFLPFGAAAMTASRVLATWNGRVRAGITLAGGLVAIASALALLAALRSSSEYVTGVLPGMVLLGIGGTAVMVTASNTATITAGSDAGVASAAVGATQQIGAALGTALLGSIAASQGLTRAASVGALLTMAGAVLVVSMTRRSTPAAR